MKKTTIKLKNPPLAGAAKNRARSSPFISKSTYLCGLQCRRLLWTRYNAKDEIPQPKANAQAIIDQGKLVGELAKDLFPGGIEVRAGMQDLHETLRLSQELLKSRRPLFEAALAYDGAYCRADILVPAPNGAWDVMEVKSTTEVKDVHIHDLAFQRFVTTGAGLKVRRCFLVHVNKEFVRKGPIDPKKFFVRVELTSEAAELGEFVRQNLERMHRTIGSERCPAVQIGPACDDPYTCPLRDQCWSFLPEHNVFTLCRGGKRCFELFAKGIKEISAIPADFGMSELQAIQYDAVRSGKRHVNRAALAGFLQELKYPLSFLDFETFATAIPLFDGVRPYQQVPFQFSLHVVRSPGAKHLHREFLARGRQDPRPRFFSELRKTLPETGSVITYNAAFEKNVLRQGCDAYPSIRNWRRRVEARMVDLLQPFRAFDFYHPSQMGSASIKAVLPALTGNGYERQAIQEGATASREFLRVTFDEVPERERQMVRRQLLSYCGLDTEGMVRITDKLRLLAGANRRRG